MSLNYEARKKFSLFTPWLNDWADPNIFQPVAELGLKDGAPEEARAAYADFLAMVERSRQTGTRIL